MKRSFEAFGNEMRELFGETNEKVDQIQIKLDKHIKNTDLNFRQINARFDRLPSEINATFYPYLSVMEKMLEDHDRRIIALEERL